MVGSVSDSSEYTYAPIVVFAKQASQGIGGQGFTLSGGVSIGTEEWRIDGDRGLIEGKLDDVYLARVQGTPAKIWYFGDDSEMVRGAAAVINYSPGNELVKLSGAAKLAKGGQSVESDEIEYFLETGTWSAGNTSRVKMIKVIK